MSDREMRALRGRKIAMVFQEPMSALNPVFTVGSQIGDVLRTNLGMSRAEATERTVELLSLVGIPSPRSPLDSYVHEFSGGMRQRVMLAMALSCDPGFLIADEPTTALDGGAGAEGAAYLDREKFHNVDVAVRACRRRPAPGQ